VGDVSEVKKKNLKNLSHSTPKKNSQKDSAMRVIQEQGINSTSTDSAEHYVRYCMCTDRLYLYPLQAATGTGRG